MNITQLGTLNNYYFFNQKELITLKERMTAEEIAYLEEELKDCKEDFAAAKKSVIYTKGNFTDYNPKDYVSLSPYWWPDPSKEDGLPYIRHDGQVNPESLEYDKANLKKFGFDIFHLCLLYYLTGNVEYYNLFKEKTRYYLLDETTGMNPNMYHAQTIRGRDDGRCYGIIEYSANFSIAFNLINELHQMGLIEDSFKKEMDLWVRRFYIWMTTSKRGNDERDGNNNHAISWDIGAIILADFLKDDTLIKEMYERVLEYRIKGQIAEEGSMPFELARTRSQHYSQMALKALLHFSKIAEKYGYGLFDSDYARPILKSAVDYLYDRLIFKTMPWVYAQINHNDSTFFIALMLEASRKLGSKYARFDLISKDDVENEISYLIGSKLF